MTTEELNTIVQAVIDKINEQVVDFDVVSSTPESTDLLSAVRPQGDGTYQGVTMKWDDVANAVTREAKGYRDEAASAKTNVENMKASVDQTVSDFNTLAEQKKAEVQGVYQADLNELKGDLEAERNSRIEADKALSTRLQKVEVASSVNRYEIENLKAKAEGQIYRTEIVDTEAYSMDVPSSVASYAELQKIGGKSVVWNSHFLDTFSNSTRGLKILYSNGVMKVSGTVTQSGEIISYKMPFESVKKRKYLFLTDNQNFGFQLYASGVGSPRYGNFIFEETISGRSLYFQFPTKDVGTTVDETGHIFFTDLTLMFGAGNEPTLEECQKIFSADYYPYDAGTIKSFPVRTVRSLNAEGTEIGSMDVSSFTTDLKSAGSVHDEWNNGKKIKRVGERAYTSGDESDSSLITDGTTTYYPLDTPTEETVPEIDNYINVEGGGTITFESNDAVQIPIQSTTRFVVDLTSITEETT